MSRAGCENVWGEKKGGGGLEHVGTVSALKEHWLERHDPVRVGGGGGGVKEWWEGSVPNAGLAVCERGR